MGGARFDASSIELRLNTKRYIGVKQVKYKQTLTPGKVRGFAPQVLGFTRGDYDCEGSIQIYREEFQDLVTDLQTLSVGILEANFLCTVTYSETLPGQANIPTGVVGGTSTDEIVGVRFTTTDHTVESEGNAGIVIEMPFLFRYLLLDGKPALNNLFRIAAVAAS